MATFHWFTKAKKSLANKEIDYDTDSIKLALFDSSLVIDQNADQYFDAAPYTSNQVPNGSGYTTGGVALASKTATVSSLKFVMSSAAALWTALTANFRYAVMYSDSPASNKPLLGYVDLGAQSLTGVDFTISPDATNGWLYDSIA